MLQKKREMTQVYCARAQKLVRGSLPEEGRGCCFYLQLGQVGERLSVVQRGVGIDWLEGAEVELTRRLTAAQITAAQADWSLLGLTQVQGGLGLLWGSQV